MNQIIKLTEISTPFVSNCILRNPFSFIILIETLFSDRGPDWMEGRGDLSVAGLLLRKFFSIYSHLFPRDNKCIWNVGTGH